MLSSEILSCLCPSAEFVREGGEGESRVVGRTTQLVGGGGIFKDGMLVSVGHCVLLVNYYNLTTEVYFGTFVVIRLEFVLLELF